MSWPPGRRAASRSPATSGAPTDVIEETVSAGDSRLKLHFDSAALDRLTALVAEFCRRERSVTMARIRDQLGTSRRYAQVLLEHLDADKVTVRRGDVHVLRERRR
jgi:Elongation factor SelB, winged helix